MQPTDLGFDRGWLDAPAAASILRIDRQLGHPVQITEAGRTRARQVYLRDGYLKRLPGFAFALPPDPPEGPSIHQEGNATDSDEADAPWEENGWIQTALGRGERWHREYRWWLDQRRFDPEPTSPPIAEQPIIKKRRLTMHEALIVHEPTNQLIIVDVRERTLVNLGDSGSSMLRAWFAENHPFKFMGGEEWDRTFGEGTGYSYVGHGTPA